jgi:2-dehydropantoate 2-reductase
MSWRRRTVVERALPKIAVLGAGAMGGLFGGLLSEAGYPVVLIDVDDAHISAIAHRGLRLTTNASDRYVPVEAGRAESMRDVADILLVFVKAPHTVPALASVRHLIGAGTWAITLQNGLDAGERLAQTVCRRQVAIGMTNWPADLAGPGHVISHGTGEVRIWSLSGHADPCLSEIAAALTRAGLRCSVDPNVLLSIWEKAVFNAAMNAIAAVSGMQVGQMADSPHIRATAAAVVREAVTTARAAGIEADELRIWAAMEDAYATHRDHRPSMLQDLRAGRRTEIDAINGAIMAHAETLGIAVPVIETLARLVRAMEAIRA